MIEFPGGFRWTEETGIRLFLDDSFYSGGFAMSADGSFLGGQAADGSMVSEVVWTEPAWGVLSRLRQTEQSLAHFVQVLAVMPDYADAAYNARVIFNDMGRPKEAQPYLELAAAQEPNA